MSVTFAEGLTIIGALLLGASAVSGLTRRSVLSTAVLAVAAGVVLALMGIVELSARDAALVLLVELVLLLTLFSDGLLVEEGLLRQTDPVVTSSVVASARVPDRVRHTLNLESGLNDGLALPFVLFFLAFAGDPQGSAVGW
jgi:sodium/hydrogen antiporter